MYIPNHFKVADNDKLIAFIKQYNFGVIINTANQKPIATHLPFLIEERNGEWFLISHLALANEQWKHFNENEVLVIFTEPHAYISPKFYEKKQNVPTWNFVAIHCYGVPKLIEGVEELFQLMEKTIVTFEADYLQQFNSLDEKYKMGLIKGIKGFEIKVADMQAQYKLSQNKTEKERDNIITHFEKSDDTNLKGIANLMKDNEKE